MTNLRRNNNSRKDSDKEEASLPDLDGKLSKKMSWKIPSSLMTVHNAMVSKALEKPCARLHNKRGTWDGAYIASTPAQKYSVRKRAAESGVTTTIHHVDRAERDTKIYNATTLLYTV